MTIFEWCVLIGGVIGALSAAYAYVLSGRVAVKLELAAAREGHLEQEIQSMTAGSVGMGHRILALELKLSRLAEQGSSVQEGDGFAYTQAKQMFEQGADTETVASNCGFSSSEAKLMALVQKSLKQEPVI